MLGEKTLYLLKGSQYPVLKMMPPSQQRKLKIRCTGCYVGWYCFYGGWANKKAQRVLGFLYGGAAYERPY